MDTDEHIRELQQENRKLRWQRDELAEKLHIAHEHIERLEREKLMIRYVVQEGANGINWVLPINSIDRGHPDGLIVRVSGVRADQPG